MDFTCLILSRSLGITSSISLIVGLAQTVVGPFTFGAFASSSACCTTRWYSLGNTFNENRL